MGGVGAGPPLLPPDPEAPFSTSLPPDFTVPSVDLKMVAIPRLRIAEKEHASHCRTWSETPAVIFTEESVSEVVEYCKAPNVSVVVGNNITCGRHMTPRH